MGDSRYQGNVKRRPISQVRVSRGRTCGADSRDHAAPPRTTKRSRGSPPRDRLSRLLGEQASFFRRHRESPRRASHACPLSVTNTRERVSFRPRISSPSLSAFPRARWQLQRLSPSFFHPSLSSVSIANRGGPPQVSSSPPPMRERGFSRWMRREKCGRHRICLRPRRDFTLLYNARTIALIFPTRIKSFYLAVHCARSYSISLFLDFPLIFPPRSLLSTFPSDFRVPGDNDKQRDAIKWADCVEAA